MGGQWIQVPAVMYMLPDGKKVECLAPIPADLKSSYDEFTNKGCSLEGEVLRNGNVSISISHNEGDFAIELSENTFEGIGEATYKLFEKWDAVVFDEWLEYMRGDDDYGDEEVL